MKIIAYRGTIVKKSTTYVNKTLTARHQHGAGSLGRYTGQMDVDSPPAIIVGKNPRPLLPLALCVAIVAVSTASILIRFAQRDAPSLTIAAMRLFFAVLVLIPVALIRYRSQMMALTRREVFLAATAGVFLAIHFATWISSLEYTSVASSVVLVSTGPLWVALVSPFFLREQLTRTALIGLGLAILGGVIIAAGDACRWDAGIRCIGLNQFLHGRAIFGNVLALIGAWAVSGYLVAGRRLRANVPLIPYILIAYGSAALCLLIAMVVFGQSPFNLKPLAYFWIMLLAIIPQLIGHSTYNWALGFLPAAMVAVATLGEPIGSAALAYVILHETPGLAVLCGAALTLTGIYLAVRQRR